MFFVLLLSIAGSAWAVENEKLSAKNEAIIEKKRQIIEKEIAGLKDHPWAGQYYSGDGLGVNITLMLAPKNGFTVVWHGCLGLYDQNYGAVKWDGNLAKLSFALDLTNGYIGRYASEYKPIRWGKRIYLIPADEIIGFCNAINSRSEPRDKVHGSFFLRWGDENKKVSGKPELPDEFMAYLLDKPVDATIVSVNSAPIKSFKNILGDTITTVTVTVNKGKKDGLLPGMELLITKPDDVYNEVKLTKIGETQSEGEYQYRTPPPAVGWQLSTCPRWRRDQCNSAFF
jgi:hypothetical protein